MNVHLRLSALASLAAVLSMAAGTALAQGRATSDTGAASNSTLTKADRDFMMKAAQGGMAEVETGNLAAKQAQDTKVKAFGEHMVKDHSQANDKLMALAQSKGVTLPTTTSSQDQHTMEHLQGLSGADFDKAYADDMVKDHKTDVREFEHAAKNASDPDVKSFAQQTLPTLKHHLSMAEALPPESGTPR
jgi:putative membrane protein